MPPLTAATVPAMVTAPPAQTVSLQMPILVPLQPPLLASSQASLPSVSTSAFTGISTGCAVGASCRVLDAVLGAALQFSALVDSRWIGVLSPWLTGWRLWLLPQGQLWTERHDMVYLFMFKDMIAALDEDFTKLSLTPSFKKEDSPVHSFDIADRAHISIV